MPMHVALINPPPDNGKRFIREGRCMQSIASWAAVWPPLTLAGLASIARRRGAEVRLFDGNVESSSAISTLFSTLRERRTPLVIINTGFPSINVDAAFAQRVKEAIPDGLLVGIGQLFTLLEQEAMQAFPAFDAGIVGEPEATFEALLEKMMDTGRPNMLPGLMLRAGESIQAAPDRALIENLDILPFPARDLLHTDRYRLPHNGHPFTLVNIARGCPHRCSFCIAPAYHGRRVRRHSLDYVLAELLECQERFGLRDFLFWEEIFAHDRAFGRMLCEAFLDRGWKLSWATTTRADLVEPDLLRLMKQAGCFLLGLGLESSSQQILDAANKRESVEDMRQAAQYCREVGIRTMGHFIFGLPGETPATAEATVRFALDLGLDYLQCYAAVPYPKTPLGDKAAAHGWLRTTEWARYDFGGNSIMDIGTISPAEVDYYRHRLFRKFYLRPRFLAQQGIQLLRHPRQLAQAAGFLRWI